MITNISQIELLPLIKKGNYSVGLYVNGHFLEGNADTLHDDLLISYFRNMDHYSANNIKPIEHSQTTVANWDLLKTLKIPYVRYIYDADVFIIFEVKNLDLKSFIDKNKLTKYNIQILKN